MALIEVYKGISFDIPKQPPKKEILGHDLPKKEQKWKRIELPEDFEDLPIEEQEAFAYEEDKKCTEGIWFMCNGVATYITGDHYFYLQWFKIDTGYPDYRDRDRRWFYHWYLCDKDEECFGQIYGKLRRDGYSFRVCSIMLNRARKTFNAKYGIISKTGDDAKEMFNKLINGVIDLVGFFKPQIQNAEDIKNDLWFKTPQKRVTNKNRKIKKELSLNTLMSWKNTKENSFDSTKQQILSCDEAAKFPKDVNIEKWYNKGKTCLILGGRIIGKMLMGSTVNELEAGGEGFMNIWEQSDYTEKTENGRTGSGLWRYFVPSYDGMEGFVDEYGQSVIDTPETPVMGIDGRMIKKGAKQWIEAELKSKKERGDMVAYYEFKRQFPITERDMFITPADEKSAWDIDKIHQQIEHNDICVIENTLHCGYFEWENGERDSKVVWKSLPYEDQRVKHRFAWFPPIEDRNKFIIKGGKKAPANEHMGLFTLDPYAAVNTVDSKRQSKAASHAFKKFDMMSEKRLSDVFIGEYWNRLKDPLLVYDDMIKQCVYFGWALLPERNVKNCNDYFRNRDYHNYLMQAPAMTQDEYISKKGKDEDAGLANTGGKTQQQLVEYLASYISNNIGVNERTGEMGYMPFNNTLKDWLAFDIGAWTKYDLTISSMLAVVGSRAFTNVKKPKPIPLNLFPTYNNSGMESVKNIK